MHAKCQIYDAHHTFKGSRKKANEGVFKLLRLKSSRLLRKYRRKPSSRVQHCSRCHRQGHNATNKLCAAGINEQGGQGQVEHDGVLLQDDQDDGVPLQGDQGDGVDEEDQHDDDVGDHDLSINDSLANLEDLLSDSEEDLY